MKTRLSYMLYIQGEDIEKFKKIKESYATIEEFNQNLPTEMVDKQVEMHELKDYDENHVTIDEWDRLRSKGTIVDQLEKSALGAKLPGNMIHIKKEATKGSALGVKPTTDFNFNFEKASSQAATVDDNKTIKVMP